MNKDTMVQELMDSYGDWMVKNPDLRGKGGCAKNIPELPSFPLSDRHLSKIVKNIGQAAADAKPGI